MKKNILFMGDSITWGYDPVTGGRFPEDIRFAGRQRSLLPDVNIIEEGLKGRTHAMGYGYDEVHNGHSMITGLLKSHAPLDLFVIMLGTNDCKPRYALTPYLIAGGLEANLNIVRSSYLWDWDKAPEILVVSPPLITMDFVGNVLEGEFDETSLTRCAGLAAEYKRVADKLGCHFLNAADYAMVSKEDGIHMDEEGHRLLADALAEKIREILG